MSNWIQSGLPLSQANKVAILIHGRGATAEGILELVPYLNLSDFALFAPQAHQRTWYPFGFMASDQGNLSALHASIQQVSLLFEFLLREGMTAAQIYLIGFSQGACLSLEFAALHAQKLGGVVAFTGGLIGEKLQEEKYSGDFKGTPIHLSGSAYDLHVPAQRMKESVQLLRKMGAEVSLTFFEDDLHTVRPEELEKVNQTILV